MSLAMLLGFIKGECLIGRKKEVEILINRLPQKLICVVKSYVLAFLIYFIDYYAVLEWTIPTYQLNPLDNEKSDSGYW